MHELEFTDNEIRIVLNALDFYSRIWIGQYDHMLWDLRQWYLDNNFNLISVGSNKKFIYNT